MQRVLSPPNELMMVKVKTQILNNPLAIQSQELFAKVVSGEFDALLNTQNLTL
jgi:hypothetical protein